MYTRGDKVDALSKYTNTIPLNSTSLFGGCLSTSITKAASFIQDYQAMVDRFVLAGLHHPKPVALGRVIREDLRDLRHLFMAKAVTGPLLRGRVHSMTMHRGLIISPPRGQNPPLARRTSTRANQKVVRVEVGKTPGPDLRPQRCQSSTDTGTSGRQTFPPH